MHSLPLAVLLLLALLAATCASSPAATQTSAWQYTSASSVSELDGSDLTRNVKPAVTNCAVGPCVGYLSVWSCLGTWGPLSAYGPLGMNGPLGDWGANTGLKRWTDYFGGLSQKFVKAFSTPLGDGADWLDVWADFTQRAEGEVMSEYGPLGVAGPLGSSYYDTMPHINSFAQQLALGGVWSVLGPLGPLGAVGPLGPLGVYGAHGFERTDRGSYEDEAGTEQRQVVVPYDANSERTWDLFEYYDVDYALSLDFAGNDASWMTHGQLSYSSKTHTFKMHVAKAQFVTVLVVPQYQLDDFDVAVMDSQGRHLINSDENSVTGYIDWVQVRVPANTDLQVRVTFGGSAPFAVWSHKYYLYITGSTEYFQDASITGPHTKQA